MENIKSLLYNIYIDGEHHYGITILYFLPASKKIDHFSQKRITKKLHIQSNSPHNIYYIKYNFNFQALWSCMTHCACHSVTLYGHQLPPALFSPWKVPCTKIRCDAVWLIDSGTMGFWSVHAVVWSLLVATYFFKIFTTKIWSPS